MGLVENLKFIPVQSIYQSIASTRTKMSESNPTTLTQRLPTDAKNVDINPRTAHDTTDKAPNEGSFPGPGANATARAPEQPHSSKVLNKLDPRYNSDIIEAADKENRGL